MAADTATPVTEVAAALIQDESGRYLITRRRPGSHLEGLWEFPGGKREADETLEQCLRRELTEELTGVFTIEEKIDVVRWQYPEKTVVLHFYRCRLETGSITPAEAQSMAWAGPDDLVRLPFPPADATLIARLAAP